MNAASTTPRVTTVLLVDDFELAREGVKSALGNSPDIRIVGEAADSLEAIRLIRELQPTVALLDIRLAEGSGIDVARACKEQAPGTKLVVLTAHDDEQYVCALARLGVNGYLLKSASVEELLRAIRDAAEGRLFFPAAVAPQVSRLLARAAAGPGSEPPTRTAVRMPDPRWTGPGVTLSPREVEVLEYVALGYRNSDIASCMGIALKTVEAHVQHILAKTGAKSRTQATVSALRDGFLDKAHLYGKGNYAGQLSGTAL